MYKFSLFFLSHLCYAEIKDYSGKIDVLFLNTDIIRLIPPEELNDKNLKNCSNHSKKC